METYQCGNDIRLSPSAAEVLDEGEGLVNLGNVGDEEPEVVGADIGHGLRTIFILRFCGSPGLDFDAGIGGQLTNFGALSPGLWCVVPWTLVRCPLDFVVLTAPHH